jgi:hypothetical protein
MAAKAKNPDLLNRFYAEQRRDAAALNQLQGRAF